MHTRSWHKAYEQNMKETSSSDSLQSRVIVGPSGLKYENSTTQYRYEYPVCQGMIIFSILSVFITCVLSQYVPKNGPQGFEVEIYERRFLGLLEPTNRLCRNSSL